MVLANSAAFGLTAATRPALSRPLPGLDVYGAPMAATIVLVEFLNAGGLAKAAPGAGFHLWQTTDELRAAIVSGRTRLFSTPSHVPANLAVRGMPLKLLCTLSMGHLFIVTSKDSIRDFHDLAGTEVTVFFRHDMPDLVFRAVAKMEGMNPDKDMTLSYVQTGMEAAQMLGAGRTEIALLSEPAASAAIMMAGRNGRHLRRAISLRQVWMRHKPGPGIPMAAVALHADLLDRAPQIVSALRAGLRPAAARVLADPTAAAALAARSMGMRADVFAEALDHINIDVQSARAMKPVFTDFYRTLLDIEPQALAGRLPPDDFYLEL